MGRLKLWQWLILALPFAAIATFLLVAAGLQIQRWGISWIWAIFTVALVGWRWLLVKWTQPALAQVESIIAEINQEIETQAAQTVTPSSGKTGTQVETVLQNILDTAQSDRPLWEDGGTFWQRCQDLVVAIAHIYHPEVKYPLLNIYIPQAYTLIRGTVDDLDRWMQQLSPALNQVTVGQAYQAYEVYRKLEPSARKVLKAWNWAQWLLNPAAALARQATQGYGDRANQQLLVNLNQLLREAALRNLCRQAVALYSSDQLPSEVFSIATPALPKVKTQTLQEILAQNRSEQQIEQQLVNILLAGRTGSGKSSVINTLFQADLAEVDVLPSTDRIQSYHWQTQTGERLNLLDTPGYEQVNQAEFREQVLEYATQADLLLLVTPALDPALEMDAAFLRDLQTQVKDLPTIAIVTQVDRLRPIREWQPPYDWVWGDRPKEKSIREAVQYRNQQLQDLCSLVLPLVTGEMSTNRQAWGGEALSLALVNAIAPAKQLRLARFLQDLQTRTVASAKIIDKYTLQMTTSQGLTTLLKSPVLQFLSTLSTGSPRLAYVLAQQIPIEQLPIVIGKLQMAYELFNLLNSHQAKTRYLDLLSLWPVFLETSSTPDQEAWALGHALVEYWTQDLDIAALQDRNQFYLQQFAIQVQP